VNAAFHGIGGLGDYFGLTTEQVKDSINAYCGR
jgi:hypothetical protein